MNTIPHVRFDQRQKGDEGFSELLDRVQKNPAHTAESVEVSPSDAPETPAPQEQAELPQGDDSSAQSETQNSTQAHGKADSPAAFDRADQDEQAPDPSTQPTVAKSATTPGESEELGLSTTPVRRTSDQPTAAALSQSPALLALSQPQAAPSKAGPAASSLTGAENKLAEVHKPAKTRAAALPSNRNTEHAAMTEEQQRSMIRKIALAASGTGSEMRLLLDPAQLGSLQLRLQLDGKILKLEIRSESKEVAALLERDSQRIIDEISAEGLDVQDLDIGTSSRDEQQSSHRAFEDANRTNSPRIHEKNRLGTASANDELDAESTDVFPTAQAEPDAANLPAALDTIA